MLNFQNILSYKYLYLKNEKYIIIVLEYVVCIYDGQCMKRAHMQLVDNAGPDQPAHLHRLIMAIVACLQNQWTLKYMLTNRECPDQTAQMCSLIWIFAVFIWF